MTFSKAFIVLIAYANTECTFIFAAQKNPSTKHFMKNRYAVVLAGGVGSRFWPVSTSGNPKQFHDILGTGESLIQQTFRRLQLICPKENILISTNEEYKSEVMNQLEGIDPNNIMCETARRNTAPAIAYAVSKIYAQNPEASVIICPSDHLIINEAEFKRIGNLALDYAECNESLLTLGIKPTRPDTGYGYIQFLQEEVSKEVFKVKTFTEKPDLDTAKMFIESGDFLWNAGIFIWSVASARKAFENFLPEIANTFEEGLSLLNTENEQDFINKVYPSCENQSVDYGIMEKANNVFVIPAAFGWSDLGTWGSLNEHLTHDENNNAVMGKYVSLYNSKDNIIRQSGDKVAVIDSLEGYIIIDHQNALLICKRENEQKIKNFVNDIKLSAGERFV